MSKNTDIIKNILHINAEDFLGGAAGIARSLMQFQNQQNLNAKMAVGRKLSDDKNVFQIKDYRLGNFRQRFYATATKALHDSFLKNVPGAWRLGNICHYLNNSERCKLLAVGSDICGLAGSEDLYRTKPAPDIIHCHNLHGNYFDLQSLAVLSKKIPVIVTLHDRWLMAGHCAHPLNCERYQSGCGNCPDLSLPPKIEIDRTAANYGEKLEIFKKSRLYIAAPCHWIADIAEKSILAQAARAQRVIYNGVDTKIFSPADKTDAKEKLKLPKDGKTILFAASGVSNNPWKDAQTLLKATNIIASKLSQKLNVIILGGSKEKVEMHNNSTIIHRPFTTSAETLANYYRSADIYLHAAHAETFPSVILESLSCGTPVVATNVGGISEQINCITRSTADMATGALTNAENAIGLAVACFRILNDETIYKELCENAARDVHERFALEISARKYMDFYKQARADFYSRDAE